MPRGKRYTDEEKEQLIALCKKMQGEGESQQAICKAAGIAVGTYRSWFGDEKPRGKRGRRPGKKAVAEASPAAASTRGRKPRVENAVQRLAEQHDRLVSIEKEIARLQDEKKTLQGAMKALYASIGQSVLGLGAKPGRKSKQK